jgi:hypothetical protein
MKIMEIIESYFGIMTLKEDSFVSEMGNFLADVTELPANIVLWTRTQPEALPHDKYRMKIYKDRVHVATYSISSNPELLWKTGRKKYALDRFESTEAIKVIGKYTSLFIQLVDGKINDSGVKMEIKRIMGQEK